MLRTIGLMSGTSLDGVDAAWVETDGVRVGRLGPTRTILYDAALRADLRAILDRAPDMAADDWALADVVARLTDAHVRVVRDLGAPADLIGFHGQTILHQPSKRRTWQVGDAARLARETGMRVVWDFRSADVSAGGQGAPLVPVFHAALADRLEKPLAILNIGGVANVTWIGPDGTLSAFDTGPGNGPLDDWVMRHTGESFDRDGVMATAGVVDQVILGNLLAHAYFASPPPKSLDRLDFSHALAASGLDTLSPEDGAATLVAFITAAVAVAPFPVAPLRWLVCGGGRHNQAIMAALRLRLGVPVEPVEAVGWDGDALEAQCFGFLAARSLMKLPLSFPGTTGTPHPMKGGRLVLP